MGILGTGIAKHLAARKGKFVVALPAALAAEMEDLVYIANQGSLQRAVLVTDGLVSCTSVNPIAWRDVLSWRGDEDRIFVWPRHEREPDSSFTSGVQEFISSRFPGSTAAECNLHLLGDICLREIWTRKALTPSGPTFDAFSQTMDWVAGVLQMLFEQTGATPSGHWSDRFLEHWSAFVDDLASAIVAYQSPLLPRHAWELVRLSGLPLPSPLVDGNPFTDRPAVLEANKWAELTDIWTEAISSFGLRKGAMPQLLSALDRVLTTPTNSWRDLPWPQLETEPLDTPAAVAGRMTFAVSGSASFLTQSAVTYPAAPRQSWWGVTTRDLRQAMSALLAARPLTPDLSGGLFLRVTPRCESVYLLNTRVGPVATTATAKQWRYKVGPSKTTLVLREAWNKLHLKSTAPSSAQPGDAWIDPSEAVCTGKNILLTNVTYAVSSLNELVLSADVLVEFKGKLVGTVMAGKWDSSAKIGLAVPVSYYENGQWSTKRAVNDSVDIIVPSPYVQTVLVADCTAAEKLLRRAPAKDEIFDAVRGTASEWTPAGSKTIVLPENGEYLVTVFDGVIVPQSHAFSIPGSLSIAGHNPGPPTGGLYACTRTNLDDGDAVTQVVSGVTREIATFNVAQEADNVSSNLLAAVKGQSAGARAPTTEARDSVLGNAQDSMVAGLCGSDSQPVESLFQYVVSTTYAVGIWPPHPGTRAALCLCGGAQTVSLPGLGDGPSVALAATPEWGRFIAAMTAVRDELDLQPASTDLWLSSLDLLKMRARTVREYCVSHAALVRASASLGAADRFWASYPFAVLVVDGSAGVHHHELLAVLLSPMHPCRLAWAFASTLTARSAHTARRLLALLEGWNVPCTGEAPNCVGQIQNLVAVPLDAGAEQDFVGWSALAVLGSNSVTDLPTSSAGRKLPWGGRSGINKRIIERAIEDYLDVHPQVTAMVCDLRSVSPSPRSQEIDDAILAVLAEASANSKRPLAGGSRVWDCSDRLGNPPTRESLISVRGRLEKPPSFEWRMYGSAAPPADVDVAFVENASVHLSITQGTTQGVVGLLPLRRFLPNEIAGNSLLANYKVTANEDLFGLGNLLGEIEPAGGGGCPAIRAMPQIHGLGITAGARWEIMGTFNLDPKLLSTLIGSTGGTSGPRLLWEWRPSWMPQDLTISDLGRRPYYVVGRVPSSLLRALEERHSLSAAQTTEMFRTLGAFGVGIATLLAAGGTHESAAAGCFYSLKLLSVVDLYAIAVCPATRLKPTAVGVLSLDTILPLLEEIAEQRAKERADFVLLTVRLSPPNGVSICISALEVKHHGRVGSPENFPSRSDTELGRARRQVTETVKLLALAASKITEPVTPANAVTAYLKRVALSALVDLSLNFSGPSIAAADKAAIIRALLTGDVRIQTGDGVLLWFAPGASVSSGVASVLNPHGAITSDDICVRELFVDPASTDGVWWADRASGDSEALLLRQAEDALRATFGSCNGSATSSGQDLAQAIQQLPHLRSLMEDGPSDVVDSECEGLARALSHPEGTNNAGTLGGDSEAGIATSADSPARENTVTQEEATTSAGAPVPLILGTAAPSNRWTVVGQLSSGDLNVGLDLDQPKTIGVFGYMGSGKSYLLGNIIESAVEPIPGINSLPVPLAVVVFNYRRNSADRFELSSLCVPNHDPDDISTLRRVYNAQPLGLRDVHVLCLPGELRNDRLAEYGSASSAELFFNPESLGAEDWELLMGEPGSEHVFARTIRNALIDLRAAGQITLEGLEQVVTTRLQGQSRNAARLRFEFIRRYLSADQGVEFSNLLQPGRVVVIDLRHPLFNEQDALRFFLVCANHISRVQNRFNKLIVFDEAHEYISEEFADRIQSRIRLMRHEGTSYLFATQDANSIPTEISRFLSTRFVFDMGTPENAADLASTATAFNGYPLIGRTSGTCLVQALASTEGVFANPREIRVRPRVTSHGGGTRIFNTPS